MGKHTDAIGTLDNFKAPWESDTGSDAEIDAPKMKKYLYNLVLDKAKAQDARDEQAEKVTEAEKALEAAKAEVAKGDSTGKIAELEKQLTEAKADASGKQAKLDRLEVALDKGLTAKQAARLSGTTKEELEADADEYLAEVGAKATTPDPDDEDEDDDDDKNVGGRTAIRLVNPNDPKGGATVVEPDYEKIADQIARRAF